MRLLYMDRWGNPIFESFTQRRLRRLFHRQSSTALLFAVKNRNWDEVLRRCQSHPHELELRDEGTGNTPLHVACRLNPPAAVIVAMKAVARSPNNDKATPLHIAAAQRMDRASLETLLQVARQVPAEDGSTRDPTADLNLHGRAPIHHACASFRGLELETFKILFEETLRHGQVQVDASENPHYFDEEFLDDLDEVYFQTVKGTKIVNVLEIKDSATGQTPLGLLFRRYRERVRHVISRVDRLHRRHEPQRAALAAALTVHGDLGGLWERARWIVARLSEERRRVDGCSGDMPESLDPQSPGELAVAQEAATWAMEQYGDRPSMELEAHRSLPRLRTLSTLDETTVSSPSTSETEEVESDSSASSSRGKVKIRRKFRVVHASVGLVGFGCPPEMIRLAISIHPSQVKEMDEDGNLPIHVAAAASYNVVEAQPSEASMADALLAAADGADDLSVLSDAALSFFSAATVRRTTNPIDKVIKMLIQHYPDGARIPQGKSGRLPLVMAIESGHRTWEDGIRTLLNAYPPAMHKKKLIEPELYPNLLGLVVGPAPVLEGWPVAVNATKYRCETAAKSTLFDLLRNKPDWLTIGRERHASVPVAP